MGKKAVGADPKGQKGKPKEKPDPKNTLEVNWMKSQMTLGWKRWRKLGFCLPSQKSNGALQERRPSLSLKRAMWFFL